MKTRNVEDDQPGDSGENENLNVPVLGAGPAPLQLPRVDDLTDPSLLERLLGPLESLQRSRVDTNGYSGNTYERVEVQLQSGRRVGLFVKHVNLTLDWTAYRTGDSHSREASLLAEQALAGIWDVFHCPYLAFAAQGNQVGLLMEDLTPYFLPDEDTPISTEAEDAILGCLAGIHARYWDSQALDLPWFTSPATRFSVIGPQAASEEGWRQPTPPVFDLIKSGWDIAAKRLSPKEMQLLRRPALVLAESCAGLPRTLLHGDAKVAHFALMPGGGVAALDWELMGIGPSTLDLGWYLAVNSARLARPREQVIRRYRDLLEDRLGTAVSTPVWERMLSAGLLCGAVMLLWAKALVLEAGQPGAQEEWEWWVDSIKKWV